ncbi:DUF2975 domain-containing protein [Salinivibrio costicola]|uniref:DUF2975 domain-containing protein n=1 Tax=Salinivibrio costicola TaxID=51367 RepID=A0ABX6K840_SALCS|nr:DUF2975 domain-containing protein [Salinivibrio costicola]QIR06405.1 DUF2975 domain-containing protein [Salinivibrio costicola]
MQKIKRYSHTIRLALQLLTFLLPIGVIYYWATVKTDLDFITKIGITQFSNTISVYTHLDLSTKTRILAMASSIIPLSVLLYGIQTLVKLFRSYEKGIIFSVETANAYHKLGCSFLLWILVDFVYDGLISVIISFNNPAGERIISFSFGAINLMAILCGFIILTIGWVMREAQYISEESKYII